MKKRKKEKRNEAISYQRWGTSALQPRGKGNRMGALQHFNLGLGESFPEREQR